MNPTVSPSSIHETNGFLEFQITNADVSFVNALRRIILSDIPRIVLNQTQIEINTAAHFHNEMVKHRIQCIPLIAKNKGRAMTDEEIREFVKNHYIMVHVNNETPDLQYVTTKDFKIYKRSEEEDSLMSPADTREMFPAYQQDYFIDLLRLAPSRGVNIPGEQFKAKIEMSIATAKTDGCFTVVSTCSFQNTPDVGKMEEAWRIHEQADKKQMTDSGVEINESLLAFKKRDFELLDAQRYFKENSFDFVLESNGIYENAEILVRACDILKDRAQDLERQIDTEEIRMVESRTQVQRGGAEYSSMENAVDILLPQVDYTVGYLLDHLMYKLHFEGDYKLSYCGFTKYHPHLNESVLRLAFHEENDIPLWGGMIKAVAKQIRDWSTAIQTPFAKKTLTEKKISTPRA